MTAPKVSVSIITYNQVAYIAQAIDSVLAQDIDFDVEIRIGDDFSTDGTREVLHDYQRRHPDRIFLNLLPRKGEGVAGRENNVTNLRSCRGTYIAMLDGDDWWTDPGKLQRQVDMLDAAPYLGGAAHDCRFYDDSAEQFSGKTLTRLWSGKPAPREADLSGHDIARTPMFQTSTFCFRRKLLDPLPDWFWTIPLADLALFVLIAEQGRVRYIGDALSAYRVNVGGAYSNLPQRVRSKARLDTIQTLVSQVSSLKGPRLRGKVAALRAEYDLLNRRYLAAIMRTIYAAALNPAFVSRLAIRSVRLGARLAGSGRPTSY